MQQGMIKYCKTLHYFYTEMRDRRTDRVNQYTPPPKQLCCVDYNNSVFLIGCKFSVSIVLGAFSKYASQGHRSLYYTSQSKSDSVINIKRCIAVFTPDYNSSPLRLTCSFQSDCTLQASCLKPHTTAPVHTLSIWHLDRAHHHVVKKYHHQFWTFDGRKSYKTIMDRQIFWFIVIC